MKNSEFKVLLAILSTILALAIFLGCFSAYNRFGVRRPIVNNIMSLESVNKVQIDKQKEYVVTVYLGKVDNLQETYIRIDEIIAKKLEPGKYCIKIVDKRDAELEKVFVELQPVIYEALAGSRYIWLKDQVQGLGMQAEGNLFIDEQRIYIQVIKGNSYMYEVIERTEEKRLNSCV